MPVALSIILPCKNEAPSIASCVSEALESLKELGIPHEIIVVNDASSDNSAAEAAQAGARVVQSAGAGYGAAIKSGMAAARHPYAITADADGQHVLSAACLRSFVAAFSDGAEFVNGNRFHPENPGHSATKTRYLGNKAMCLLFNLRYRARLHDVTCGMNGHLVQRFLALPNISNGMEMNIDARAQYALSRAKIQEIDIRTRPRSSGASHVRPVKDGVRHSWHIIKPRKP